jgi:hypothetical protein
LTYLEGRLTLQDTSRLMTECPSIRYITLGYGEVTQNV